MSLSFADFGLPADLAAVLSKKNITIPTPIQAGTLAAALEGRDVAGRAPTGSGKTLAFGLAVVTRTGKPREKRPRALILAPTRELVSQIAKELQPLAEARHKKVLTVYGGVGYENQRRGLKRGADIVIACPGRLEDLIKQRAIKLDEVDIVVLDEADRMCDMGFMPAVRRLLEQTNPAARQTLLFSATLDGDVDAIVREYQDNPQRYEVSTEEDTSGEISHVFWKTDRDDRLTLTKRLVAENDRSIVFCRTKHGADRLAKQLGESGVKAVAIHGDRSQSQRERALAAFSNGRASALVATDVAARGIHVDDVSVVVHFDPPADSKDYTHRSGRTGRAGSDGQVVSFICDDQRRAARTMQKQLGLPEQFQTPNGEIVKEAPMTNQSRPTRGYGGRSSGGGSRGRSASRSGSGGSSSGKPYAGYRGRNSGAPKGGEARNDAPRSNGAPRRGGSAGGNSAGRRRRAG